MKIGTLFLAPLLALFSGSFETVQAQTSTLLEGFEENTNSAAVFTTFGGRSAAGKVTIKSYTATSPQDPKVTEGTNSIAVTIKATGFGNDLEITLPEAASTAIHEAIATSQVARYILRYDLILANPSLYSYFNQQPFIGRDWNYVTLGAANSNGLVTFSCALDLPGLQSLGEGPVKFVIANNFGTVRAFPSAGITFYMDNFRLVDTYGAGIETPITHLIQSFENPSSLNTVTNFTGFDGTKPIVRTSYSLYEGTGDPSDIFVTDGTRSLQVDNSNPAGFHADFIMSLAGTKLAEVLRLDLPPAERPTREELASYTLRFDAILPEVSNDGNYQNQPFFSGSTYFPVGLGRRQHQGQTDPQSHTYSITLDQVASWNGTAPSIVFINDGPGGPEPATAATYYYDNFRLIQTAAGVVPKIRITQFNFAAGSFSLTWDSVPDAVYTIEYSATLAPGSFAPLTTGINSGGAQTTSTVTMPNGQAGYLKIQKQ